MIKSEAKFYDVLNERTDAPFFNRRFISLINNIKSISHKPLYKLVDFSSESWNQKDYFEDYFPYIEISAIDIHDGTITEISNVEKTNAPSRAKKIVRNNDIIVSTTRPNRGAISFVRDINNIVIASTGFAVIRENGDEILREYLYIMLRQKSSLLQMEQRSSGGNYPAITEDELKKILIPLPTKEIQQKVVDLYQHAVKEKQNKEQEAKTLLAGIDNYLLEELEIVLPKNAGERYFEVIILDLIGERFDVKDTRFKTYKRKSIKYNEILVSEIASINKGKSITKDKIIDGNYPVIAGGQTSPYSHAECNEIENVITISASGAYSGYVWFHDYKIFASDCSVIRSKDETQYMTEYIYSVLKLKQDEIYRMQKGAGQPHVYPNDIATVTIPIVSIEKQHKIIKHIQSIRAKAKHLQEEAREVLNKAKEMLEKIIIGD